MLKPKDSLGKPEQGPCIHLRGWACGSRGLSAMDGIREEGRRAQVHGCTWVLGEDVAGWKSWGMVWFKSVVTTQFERTISTKRLSRSQPTVILLI